MSEDLSVAEGDGKLGKNIVIANNGWVFIGLVTITKEWIEIDDCYVIRKWGTTKGLGQIALSGPTKDTILDEAGIVRIKNNDRSVVAFIKCRH
jgi:hypothetical protein